MRSIVRRLKQVVFGRHGVCRHDQCAGRTVGYSNWCRIHTDMILRGLNPRTGEPRS